MTGASLRVIRGLWGSTHPGPTLVVTVLAAALSLAAGLGPGRIGLLTAAVFAGQLSVGLSNDAFDAARDRAVGRTDKPIARGEISTSAAWTAAFVSLALALALSVPLGLGLVAAHALFLASAWSYNAGVKASPLSIVPFILGFGAFPAFATLAAPDPQLAAFWALLAGGALGAAIHLTNVLPDLDDDARTGISGLPHRLGARPSAALAAAAVLTGAIAVTAGAAQGELAEIPAISWVFFALEVAVVLVTFLLAVKGRSGRVLFRLVMLAALLLAAQLVAAGGSLTG
ncbi:UbiA family prenyltransferase [Nesterenkonia lutea]|uniref:4-hydroxybenzoate polyprenyltransferase n=1 Tax=Nesterenkonia lutea TaxID=272919 RepID=A0ABR9JHE4_9MICC|nr:UbiA family prenyltransferase [Nesterenkonia lutea]MBE1525366.1 4-hydroxybenzoate polyprenyltransferase [Nesterenkonia lutea]